MKRTNAPNEVGQVVLGAGFPTHDPGLEIGVRQRDQALEIGELGLAHRVEAGLAVAAQQPIHFLGAAMVGTVGGAAAARIQFVHGGSRAGKDKKMIHSVRATADAVLSTFAACVI